MKKSLLYSTLIILLMLTQLTAFSNAFVSTWLSGGRSLVIPVNTSETYNYSVTWTNLSNPGEKEGSLTGQTGEAYITDLSSGDTYQIEITGLFPQIKFFGSGADFNSIKTIEQWGDNQWKSFQYAFMYCENLKINASDTPDFSQVTNLHGMFAFCTNLIGNASMSSWNTTNVTRMSWLFFGASSFNTDIGNWNTSNVTNMNGMFKNATAFNLSLANWDVSNVSNMGELFDGATSFNQSIGSWTTSSVTNMFAMFKNATAFNQDIGSWDVGEVDRMHEMFFGATNFNQNIGSWSTNNVSYMDSMFCSASAFNQNISNWSTTGVLNMNGMFKNATAFNQILGGWSIATTKLQDMFSNSGMSCANYSSTIKGWHDYVFIRSNVIFTGQNNMQYGTDVVTERDDLINLKNWQISEDASSGTACLNPTSAEWFSQKNDQKIKPNPAFGQVQISCDDSYQISNVSGQLMYQGNDQSISISNYPSGLYLVKFTDGTVEKLIVQ